MVFDALRLDEVRSWVYVHSDAYWRAFPVRQVNNIYFDTYERDLIMDHINGVSERAKFRFRWYGDTWTARDGQLELKQKRGELISKVIQAINKTIDLNEMSWGEVLDLLMKKSSDRFCTLLRNTDPVLINQYWREYYVSVDELVRVTLDYDMRAFGQSFGFSPNISMPQPLNNNVIIEVKAEIKDSSRVSDSLAEFPLYCSKFSKLLVGSENVY